MAGLLLLVTMAAVRAQGELRCVRDRDSGQHTEPPRVAGCVAEVVDGGGGALHALYRAQAGYEGGGLLVCEAGTWVRASEYSDQQTLTQYLHVLPHVGYPQCALPGCADDPAWRARTSGMQCTRVSWRHCATTLGESGASAARACAATCGSCELLMGLPEGSECEDDSSWVAARGQTCRTLVVLASQQDFDIREMCAKLRSGHRTAVQACPAACGACERAQSLPDGLSPPSNGEGTAESADVASIDQGAGASAGAQVSGADSSGAEEGGSGLAGEHSGPGNMRIRGPLGLLPVSTAQWSSAKGMRFVRLAASDDGPGASFYGAVNDEVGVMATNRTQTSLVVNFKNRAFSFNHFCQIS